MVFNKEKNKLDNLLATLGDIRDFNEPNLAVMNDGFAEYTKVIRALYKVKPNVFANLHNYDLAEIRNYKKRLTEDYEDETQHDYFLEYKESILNAIDSATEYITDYAQ